LLIFLFEYGRHKYRSLDEIIYKKLIIIAADSNLLTN